MLCISAYKHEIASSLKNAPRNDAWRDLYVCNRAIRFNFIQPNRKAGAQALCIPESVLLELALME